MMEQTHKPYSRLFGLPSPVVTDHVGVHAVWNTYCCLFEEEAEISQSLHFYPFLCSLLLFSPAGNPPNKKKSCGGVGLRVKQFCVSAFSVFFLPWVFLIVREERKRRLDPFKCCVCSVWQMGNAGIMLCILVIFNTSLVIVFTSQKATHRLLSSAALFYSGFYCVILIWPRPVTHTTLSDRSVAWIVVQSTLAGGA